MKSLLALLIPIGAVIGLVGALERQSLPEAVLILAATGFWYWRLVLR